MDDEGNPRQRGAGNPQAWQRSPEYLRERIENLERQLRETKAHSEARCREMTQEYDRRMRELMDGHAKALKEVEEAGDKRISKIETFLLSGLGLVATLFVGALFTIVSGGPG